MAKKKGFPVITGTVADPTGQDRLERAAIKDFNRRLNLIKRHALDELANIPYVLSTNTKYGFSIDSIRLSSMLTRISDVVTARLLEGGTDALWFFEQYVETAAVRGVAQQHANLANQSAVYAADRASVSDVLQKPAYKRRMLLLAAREYEELRDLTATTRTLLSRALTDGLARGRSPNEVASDIRDAIHVSKVRAARLARTETLMALRRARMDEADDAAEELGLKTKEMHLSALSPTTRTTHAHRHGKLYTSDEQRDWWSENGNAINCKCGTVSVLLEASGAPAVPEAQDMARSTYDKMREKGYDWAK